MSRFVWSIETLKQAATPYRTRQEFVKGNFAAYSAAAKRKILDDVCAHMEPPKNAKIPDAELYRVAKLFENVSEFRKTYPSHYQAAHSRGIAKSVCAHMTRKKHDIDYPSYFAEKYGDKYNLLSNYQSSKERVSVSCKTCNSEWSTIPFVITCKTCGYDRVSKALSLTHDEYTESIPNTIECLETYNGAHQALLHKCKTCNHEWSTKPMNIRSGRGCPKCAIAKNAKSLSESKRYTREQYINLIPQFTLIGEYQGIHVKSLHRCNQCGHEWLVKPTITLRGYDCPKRCTKPDDHIRELFEKFGDDVKLVKWNSNSSTKAEYICSKNHTFHTTPKDMLRMQGCRRCNSNGISVAEQILCGFVENLGFTIERNTRSIISPKELDIYIPAKKIAIEFNGTYWHSQHPPIYHLNKTIDCEKLGIHLIHVWEHEFDNPIMRSIIANALGCCARTYYARECNVKYLAWNEARDFLNTHHIQGAGAATNHNVALCYGDEIIAVMTFGKPRFQPITTDWELIRYAVAMDTHIIGGAARLWSKRPTGSIVTYSDRRLFTGQLYERLGFDRGHASAPGYFYIGREGQIVSRYKSQRKKLPELLGSQFNAELSEAKNMELAGYVKIHDCGIIRWTYDVINANVNE